MMPIRRHFNGENRDHEPEPIRELSKKKIYEQLAEQWFLPEINSKGVNRAYIVGVYTGTFLRLPLVPVKQFLAGLTPGQLKKAPFHNASNAYAKLTRLIVELGENQFGCDEG